jgi:hypothetical protein
MGDWKMGDWKIGDWENWGRENWGLARFSVRKKVPVPNLRCFDVRPIPRMYRIEKWVQAPHSMLEYRSQSPF